MSRVLYGINLHTPKGWRKGQTIFNFLGWLKTEKGYSPEFLMGKEEEEDSLATGRMADPFHIPDKELDELFMEFLKSYEVER